MAGRKGRSPGYGVIGQASTPPRRSDHRYPAQLIVQDVRALHGSQFKDAALIVASPPCQAYSYRAMPWKRAKALPPPDNTLFNECFRIQREACEAAGRHIPLIVENVRGAQKWVGRARWNFGSFYLWGDVPALMPMTLKGVKLPGFRFDDSGRSFQSASVEGCKGIPHRTAGHWTNPAEHEAGVKHPESGHAWYRTGHGRFPSASSRRKMASAMIAKIPLPLAQHIAANLPGMELSRTHHREQSAPSSSRLSRPRRSRRNSRSRRRPAHEPAE